MERTKRRAVAVALVLVACVGCGQGSVTPTAQSLPPVTMEVKPAQPVKKTYTREELAKWWRECENSPTAKMSPADLKKHLGPPDETYEKEFDTVQGVPGYGSVPAKQKVLVYCYKGISVDAAGSGKVDRETLFGFVHGFQWWKGPEFVP